MANGPIRRKTEVAVRDRSGNPVGLLYDEDNDKTVMRRGNSNGAAKSIGTSVLCTNNSTEVQLGGGAKFTGTPGDLNGYATIMITIYSDQDSATDGLRLFFSHNDDPYQWHEADAYTYVAESYKTYSFQPVDQYFKVEYTNGGVATNNLHISTRLHSSTVKASSHRMADDIKGQDDAELVKAVLAAEKAGSVDDLYTNIQATTAGNLKVSIEESDSAAQLTTKPYLYAISEGQIADHYGLAKFGMNDNVGATFETVWDGAVPYVWPTSAATVSITGGAADVLTTGTGAWTVNILGLDENWDEANETVEMNGATPVVTTTTFIRVFRMKVLTAGTDGTNNANIVAAQGANTVAQITAGYGQTLMALWSVPDGFTLRLVAWYANTSVITKVNETRMRVREFGGAWQTKSTIHINGSGASYDWRVPLAVPAKSDIEIQSRATVGGGDCASGFDGWYEL